MNITIRRVFIDQASTWAPYLWAVPLAAGAYLSKMNSIFTVLFAITVIGYPVTLAICCRKPATLHQLGHLLLFVIVSETFSEGDCGVRRGAEAFILAPAIVAFGAITLAVSHFIRRSIRRHQQH